MRRVISADDMRPSSSSSVTILRSIVSRLNGTQTPRSSPTPTDALLRHPAKRKSQPA